MVETLKKVTLRYESFKDDELLRVSLVVVRTLPYISSEWPSRIILWLSRRYCVEASHFAMTGDNSFILVALLRSDRDFFRQWSHNALLDYVRRIVK